MPSLFDTPALRRRDKLTGLLIQSLAHRSQEDALATVLAWFSLKDLEEIAPTLSGDPDIISKLPRK